MSYSDGGLTSWGDDIAQPPSSPSWSTQGKQALRGGQGVRRPMPLSQSPPSGGFTFSTSPPSPSGKGGGPSTRQYRTSSVPCKYYNQPGGCQSGRNCKFAHSSASPPLVQGPGSSPRSPPASEGGVFSFDHKAAPYSQGGSSSGPSTPRAVCRFHAKGFCRAGRRCPYLHANPGGRGAASRMSPPQHGSYVPTSPRGGDGKAAAIPAGQTQREAALALLGAPYGQEEGQQLLDGEMDMLESDLQRQVLGDDEAEEYEGPFLLGQAGDGLDDGQQGVGDEGAEEGEIQLRYQQQQVLLEDDWLMGEGQGLGGEHDVISGHFDSRTSLSSTEGGRSRASSSIHLGGFPESEPGFVMHRVASAGSSSASGIPMAVPGSDLRRPASVTSSNSGSRKGGDAGNLGDDLLQSMARIAMQMSSSPEAKLPLSPSATGSPLLGPTIALPPTRMEPMASVDGGLATHAFSGSDALESPAALLSGTPLTFESYNALLQSKPKGASPGDYARVFEPPRSPTGARGLYPTVLSSGSLTGLAPSASAAQPSTAFDDGDGFGERPSIGSQASVSSGSSAGPSGMLADPGSVVYDPDPRYAVPSMYPPQQHMYPGSSSSSSSSRHGQGYTMAPNGVGFHMMASDLDAAAPQGVSGWRSPGGSVHGYHPPPQTWPAGAQRGYAEQQHPQYGGGRGGYGPLVGSPQEEAYFYGGVGSFSVQHMEAPPSPKMGGVGVARGQGGAGGPVMRWAEVVGGPRSSGGPAEMAGRRSQEARGAPVSSSSKICRFFLQGNCLHGARCRNSHEIALPDLDAGAEPARTPEEIRRLDEEEIRRSIDAECIICHEIIRGRFGLLSHCTHAFCLECIRTWRQQGAEGQETSNVRSCPVCKQLSWFVIPHVRHVTDPVRKGALISIYKQAMGKRPCKYFQDGEECPFGSSCFYAHLRPDGSRASPPRLRTRMGAEGQTEVMQDVKLSHFFDARRP